MTERVSLKQAERRAFSTAVNDGLWDILLGCFFLVFAIAPLLSTSLGDFWGSAVFWPFCWLVYLAVRLIRKHVVTPRVGVVRFGRTRRARLRRFTVAMLVVNVIAFILGLVAVMSFDAVPGQVYTATLGLILLISFSIAGYLLDISRLYFYGLLVGLSFLVGEWLWAHGYASHHGFPITFGVTAGIMILAGLAVFARLLHDNPLPIEGNPSEEA